MRRGQSAGWAIVGFILLVGVIGFIAIAFKPTLTGKSVSESYTINENFVSEPFMLRAWVVDEDSVQLDVLNKGVKNYIIVNVEVDGCGSVELNEFIEEGDSEILVVPCTLEKDSLFEGSFMIGYVEEVGNKSQFSLGELSDIV